MSQERTWLEVFARQVRERPDRPALLTKETGSWQPIAWKEFDRRTRQFARALLANGIERGQVVGILSSNRWQWSVADLATVLAGGIGVGVYPTSSPEQCEYILNHSETRWIFCDHKEQVQKILSIAGKIPTLRKIITLDKTVSDPRVIHWEAWVAQGDASELGKRLDDRMGQARPDDVIMYVYTSGTTGPPKCVQLAHENVLPGLREAMPYFDNHDGDTGISYLPPAHVADRIGAFYLCLLLGGTLAFVESVPDMIPAMKEVRPHVMVWVPRICEKVYAKIQAGVAAGPPLKRRIFHWALETGRKTGPYRMRNQPIPFPLSLSFALAKKLVYDKLNANLLGGRLRYFLSGSAPLSKEVGEFFFNLNLPIYETWSMSETSALATVNRPGHLKFGSVGQPLPMVDIQIDTDGEILIKGPNVMRGYLKNEAANRETFTEKGYLRTGDIGRFDEDGYLYITDRKKDLIITSSGKNIAPQNIENLLKQSRYISLAMAFGDNRNFITALITLDPEEIKPWAEANGLGHLSLEDLSRHEKTVALIQKEVEAINARLARIEAVKKFFILPRDFSVDEGEITPTLKLKRKVLHQKHKALLESFYAE